MESDLRQVLTKLNKQGMISYIKSHPREFTNLIKLSMADDHPYSWRASWLLWSVMNDNDKRLKPYIQAITKLLPDRNPSQQREFIIILQKMELPEYLTGGIFDICISIWTDPAKSLSLRYNAFKLMVKITKQYPDLLPELELLAGDEFITTITPSLRRCIANQMKKRLK